MRRALAAGLLAAGALAAGCRAHAQPVAQLEVTKPSKLVAAKELTQHQRIEAIVSEILELVKALGPGTTKPVPPKPVEPAIPAAPVEATPNPFVAWREQGISLLDIQMWRLGRGLTPAELEQAYRAGYPRPGGPSGDPGPGAGVDPRGFDLGAGGGTVLQHTVAAGQPLSVSFTVAAGGGPAELWVFGVSGGFFGEVTDSGPGFSGRRSQVIGSFHKALDAVQLAPGRYTYTFVLDHSAQVGIQFRQ